jgi:hypothetical protein
MEGSEALDPSASRAFQIAGAQTVYTACGERRPEHVKWAPESNFQSDNLNSRRVRSDLRSRCCDVLKSAWGHVDAHAQFVRGDTCLCPNRLLGVKQKLMRHAEIATKGRYGDAFEAEIHSKRTAPAGRPSVGVRGCKWLGVLGDPQETCLSCSPRCDRWYNLDHLQIFLFMQVKRGYGSRRGDEPPPRA